MIKKSKKKGKKSLGTLGARRLQCRWPPTGADADAINSLGALAASSVSILFYLFK